MLGYEFSETQILITKDVIVFLGSAKKSKSNPIGASSDFILGQYLEALVDQENDPQRGVVQILTRDPKNEDSHEAVYQEFLGHIKGKSPKIGVFAGLEQGRFVEALNKSIPAHFERKDAGPFLHELVSSKTDEDMEMVQKAGCFTAFVTKRLISRIEDVVDEENKVSHSKVANDLKTEFEEEESKVVKKFKAKYPDIDYE